VTEFKRIRFIVIVDIERAPSDYMMNARLSQSIEKELRRKKLNYGEVQVHVGRIEPVEDAALKLAETIVQHVSDQADNAASEAVGSHEDHYSH
jgi:hypothetical protein